MQNYYFFSEIVQVFQKKFCFFPFHRRFPMFKMRESMLKMREWESLWVWGDSQLMQKKSQLMQNLLSWRFWPCIFRFFEYLCSQ